MKFPRKAQLWLADQYPAFDRPGLYRRTPAVSAGPVASGWDAVLIAMVSSVLIGAGVLAVLAGLFVVGVIIATWLS